MSVQDAAGSAPRRSHLHLQPAAHDLQGHGQRHHAGRAAGTNHAPQVRRRRDADGRGVQAGADLVRGEACGRGRAKCCSAVTHYACPKTLSSGLRALHASRKSAADRPHQGTLPRRLRTLQGRKFRVSQALGCWPGRRRAARHGGPGRRQQRAAGGAVAGRTHLGCCPECRRPARRGSPCIGRPRRARPPRCAPPAAGCRARRPRLQGAHAGGGVSARPQIQHAGCDPGRHASCLQTVHSVAGRQHRSG